MAQYFDDRNIVPEFRTITVINEAKSHDAGRPIYDEMEVVEIRFGGDMQNRPLFPAHDGTHIGQTDGTTQFVTYAERFPKQYERFKAGKVQAKDGTPLDEVPFLTAKQVSELKGLQIYTIEQLASLDDRRLKSLGMFGREAMERARAYIETASDSSRATALAAENAELKARVEALEAASSTGQPKDEGKPPIDDKPVSDFDDWDLPDLKDYIEQQTGARPRGNPSKETLVRMAEEATEK